jgi:hypothetical protein
MKKILTLIVASMLTLSSQSFAKDFGDYKIDAELGYAMDGWTQAGSDLNSARPVGYASLDIEKTYNDTFRILLENAMVEIEDDTRSDGSYSIAYSHRLTASYLINGWDIGIYGQIEDKNEDSKNGDNYSYQGLDIGYTVNGYRISVDYAEDLTDGTTTDSGVKYAEEITVWAVEKTVSAFGKNIDLEFNYWDIDNNRDTYSLDAEVMLTENFGFGVLVGDNDGKGLFASTDSQQRDFAAARVFVKY